MSQNIDTAKVEDLEDVKLITDLLTSKGTQEDAGRTAQTLAMVNVITIYRFPDNITDRQRKAVMICMTLPGRCVDQRARAWQTLVLTWTVMCFPELIEQISAARSREYTFEMFPMTFIESCETVVSSFAGDVTPTGESFVSFPSHIPNAGLIPVTVELCECATIDGLYAFYALIVFLMGKNINSANRVQITTNRPNALIRRFGCESAEYILKGEGRIGDECHSLMTSGWVRSTGPRMVIVRHFAGLMVNKSQQSSVEILANTFSLLEYSGAQSIYYINQLLQAMPWISREPIFRASYLSYADSIRRLHTQPSYLKPYYKLMMHDSTKLFRRRDLDPLIAVSIIWARQTNSTLSRFTIAANMQGPIDAFAAGCKRRGIDLSLPENQETVTATQ